MIHLGTQYYRPPFPEQRFWEDDLKQMADSGLNTVQLWVVWAWVESKPDTYRFDDYERIVEIADKNGLAVVLSTIAAVHPYWIHRVVPGSEMVDNMGHKVVSSNRGEIHFGITPGGCFDHPGVWDRMARFISATVENFRKAGNLAGWDAWNELRWNVQADGLVCYCPYTLDRFRRRLDALHGGLEGLNEAWKRRYSAWDEVMPGKSPDRPYTEMIAFQEFISRRSVRHARDRYDLIKGLDPDRPVTVHGGQPTVLHGNDSYPGSTALHRGNDWYFSDHIDGVGCSSFPKWLGREMDHADFISRIDTLASAAQGKRIWLSELQGGRSNIGFQVAQSVDAPSQQRWIWTGISAGAETILFWCWRDEVFGRESNGFGLAGNDGLAEERMAAMRKSGRLFERYGKQLSSYKPDKAEIGIFFSPLSYYLHWSQDGTAKTALQAILGYARALVRLNIPYRIVEENHLQELSNLKLLIMPRALVMDEDLLARLEDFVDGGGALFYESETGAFSPAGLYSYPNERLISRIGEIREVGRRRLTSNHVMLKLDGRELPLPAGQWLTPYTGAGTEREAESLGDTDEGSLLLRTRVGRGVIFACATYLGDPYLAGSQHGDASYAEDAPNFEAFLSWLTAEVGVVPSVRVVSPRPEGADFVHVRAGKTEHGRLLFVFLPPQCFGTKLAVRKGYLSGTTTDLVTGEEVHRESAGDEDLLELSRNEWGFSVLLVE
jgi:beta-galactosidase